MCCVEEKNFFFINFPFQDIFLECFFSFRKRYKQLRKLRFPTLPLLESQAQSGSAIKSQPAEEKGVNDSNFSHDGAGASVKMKKNWILSRIVLIIKVYYPKRLIIILAPSLLK